MVRAVATLAGTAAFVSGAVAFAPSATVRPASVTDGVVAGEHAQGSLRGSIRTAAAGSASGSSGSAVASVGLAGLFLSAASRRKSQEAGRDSGRVIVRGRNFETNIKKKKGPAEQKKARITAKHLGFVKLALKEGQPDESANPRLKRAIVAAMKDNVPRATIDKSIKKHVEGGEAILEIDIGGYGVGGVAVLLRCVTDNANRCRMDVKEAFKEIGGQVGNNGCVDNAFTKQGVLRFAEDEDKVFEASMETEIEDCVPCDVPTDDGKTLIKVTTLPQNLHAAQHAFEDQGLESVGLDIEFDPVTQVELGDEATYEMKHLMELLEEIPDVQGVYHNGILKEGIEVVYNPYGAPFGYERAMKGK